MIDRLILFLLRPKKKSKNKITKQLYLSQFFTLWFPFRYNVCFIFQVKTVFWKHIGSVKY